MPDPGVSDVHVPVPLGNVSVSYTSAQPVHPPAVVHRDGKWYVEFRGKTRGPYVSHEEALRFAQTLAKSADTSGAMIAFRPPNYILDALFPYSTEDYNNLHATIVYIGDSSDIPEASLIHLSIEEFCRSQPPLTATISGFGIFSNLPEPVLVALLDIPRSTEFRTGILQTLAGIGVFPPESHGWVSHITLQYNISPTISLPVIPEEARDLFPLDSIAVVIDEDWDFYPLAGVTSSLLLPAKSPSS